ncbi:hypothetical protein ACVNS2_16470 [Paenibacillus caseinilyticus]|uniref:Uncharacterized protein n=1 Tax=Paenibacillus mucilaginosus K02 TaxID=997761 RepID=I0BIP0_9BACL|nr:hypothetical protein [Paenibacillus mucilaginosus]AFH62237.1 hypothetical protein B2K_16165 [Paenibacillus mucilaginosus K02]
MRKQMTESEWRGQMLAWKKSRTVIEGMDVIDKLIAESEHEVAAAAKEKTRRSGRASLRTRLKLLMLLFYHRTNVRGKGASPDA